KELRSNREFVLAAVRKNGRALKYAPERFKSNGKFVSAAM
ncbi:MAG: DUF4116 domain-containing protein, partial [Parachlamydiaceae bacterium]